MIKIFDIQNQVSSADNGSNTNQFWFPFCFCLGVLYGGRESKIVLEMHILNFIKKCIQYLHLLALSQKIAPAPHLSL